MIIAAVACGGVLGALARFALGHIAVDSSFPWITLTINIVGCLAIGMLASYVRARHSEPHWLYPLIGTGFLGGFTTMSAYAVDVIVLADRSTSSAVIYACITVLATIVAAYAGTRIIRARPA